MLSSWFERGLGQIVAPDEKAKSCTKEDRDEEGFWSVVAPDNRTPQEKRVGPPPSAFLSPLPASNNSSMDQVQCVNCHQMTPVAPSTPSLNVAMTTTPEIVSTQNNALDGKVLSAAKDTAESMISPPAITDTRNKVFRLCASSKPLAPKLCKRLRRLLKEDPSLVESRASRMDLVPDGHTPLMATASANRVDAAEIILEVAPDAVNQVDLQGRTALHIAAELGNLEMVELLKGRHPEGPDAPVDLTGHTPLGRAITSNHKAAKQNQSQLQEKLFSPGDVSVCGRPTPAKTRSAQLDLQLTYGYADMPGFRVRMEDAVSCHVWPGRALFGICDGHGDNRQVSAFVAEQVKPILENQLAAGSDDMTAVWTETCHTLDAQLKETGRKGGSTAVWALVTESSVVVANVGDSRCILIQRPEEGLEKAMEQLKIEDGTMEEGKVGAGSAGPDEKEVLEQDEELTSTTAASDEPPETKVTEEKKSDYIVTPLSEDHKPNLELERVRIENAGLVVTADTFMDDGVECTIHKVQLSENDRLAVSRAFGDFEYKSNGALPVTEQAVVATPEIRMHARNKDRDMFLVLACDGVWDVMSNDEVGDFVVKHVRDMTGGDSEDILPKAGDMLVNECLRRGSTDNMTVVLVSFDIKEQLDGTARRIDFPSETMESPLASC